jgi:hypothetical protein
MVVAFHLHRRPLSSTAKLSRGYTTAISEAAKRHYTGPLLSNALYSRIIWFHKYRSYKGDADNIIKKVHDALKDVLFADDRVITHTMAVRVDASDVVEIEPDPDNPIGAEALSESIGDPEVRDVLYIEIGLQTESKIYLGPIA